MTENKIYLLHDAKHTPDEKNLMGELSDAFDRSSLPIGSRLQSFPRHVRRQDIARFLTKWELFKLNLSAHGSVVECGVFAGGGLISWMQFSAILEPYNHQRRVIGFDTFSGFPEPVPQDTQHGSSEHLRYGGLDTSRETVDELHALIALHDRNRPLGHIEKTELVVGDATQTIPKYVENNPHLLISLLYLDFDIYEPTKTALEHLLPRVSRGGIVAFDELNCPEFPGETTALLESLDLSRVKLERLPYDPYISYFIRG